MVGPMIRSKCSHRIRRNANRGTVAVRHIRRVAWSLGCHGRAAKGSHLPNPAFRVAMSLPRDRDMATRRVRFRSRTLNRVAMAPYRTTPPARSSLVGSAVPCGPFRDPDESVLRVESRRGAVARSAPFPRPAHRTGRADFPHPALGEGFDLARHTELSLLRRRARRFPHRLTQGEVVAFWAVILVRP